MALSEINTRYQALFHDGTHAISRRVDVCIFDSGIELYDKDNHKQFFCPFHALHITDAPRDGQSGHLHCTEFPESQLVVSQELFSAIKPHLRNKTPWNLAAMICLFGMLLGLLVFILIPRAAPIIANRIPAEIENKIGAMVLSHFTQDAQLCYQQSKAHKHLQSLADDLTQASGVAPVKMVILQSKQVNAMALPGRQVVILSGLIHHAKTPEELAGIVAHEIGHIVYNHSMEKIVRILGISGILEVVTGGGGTILFLATEMYHNAYNRDKEQEADAFAAAVMQQKNYDLEGVIKFFARSMKEEKGGMLGKLSWLSTHPPHQTRIDFFRQHKQETQSSTPVMTNTEWKALKNLEGCDFIKVAPHTE